MGQKAEREFDMARAVGVLCGSVGVADVVDGYVARHARHRDLAVLTSIREDIARPDPTQVIMTVYGLRAAGVGVRAVVRIGVVAPAGEVPGPDAHRRVMADSSARKDVFA